MTMQAPINIKSVRETLGLNQSAFAERIGTDQGTVSAWETGKHRPSKAVRKMIERLIEEHQAA